MKTTVEFLDGLRAKHRLTSDYQLAKYLNIRPNRISNYRLGKSLFDEETCLLIAADLDLDPGYVFACIAAERANKPEVKAAWKHTAEVRTSCHQRVDGMLCRPNNNNQGMV